MADLNFQGKIVRQFWGKLIRQSETSTRLQYVIWGGDLNYQNGSLGNKVTFFHSVKRIE